MTVLDTRRPARAASPGPRPVGPPARPPSDGPAPEPPARRHQDAARPALRPLLGHSPALDGLRGLAVLLVLTYHFTGLRFLPGGWSGVDVFFVLSGFLITSLLLDERRVHGRVDLARFYARRAARLLPALLTMLSIWSGLLLVFHDTTWFSAVPGGDGTGGPVAVLPALADVGISLVYAANWMYALAGGHAPLAHLWSLSVEEQFYLLWPASLLLLLRLGGRARVAVPVGLLLASAATPWLLWNDSQAGNDRVYFGSDTRAVGLLAGAVAAMLWHRRVAAGRTGRFGSLRAWCGLAVVTTVALRMGNVPAKFLLAPVLLALAVAQVVPHLAEHPDGPLGRLLQARWLVWAGRRSYALYLWHYLWATWTHPLPGALGVTTGVLGALACTQLSWVLVEAPVLRWARRFRPPVTAMTRTSEVAAPA